MKITTSEILKYIKSSLGGQFQIIELTDEEIMTDIIQKEALIFFSKYYPTWKFFEIENYLTLGQVVENTCDMRTVLNSLPTPESVVLSVPTPLQSELDEQAARRLAIYNESQLIERIIGPAALLSSGGDYNTIFQMDKYTYKMGEMNLTENTIKFKMIHKKDLSTMTFNHYDKFKELCLHLTAKKLLPIRKFNAQIETPLGAIIPDVETVANLVDYWQEFFTNNFDKARNADGKRRMYIA